MALMQIWVNMASMNSYMEWLSLLQEFGLIRKASPTVVYSEQLLGGHIPCSVIPDRSELDHRQMGRVVMDFDLNCNSILTMR